MAIIRRRGEVDQGGGRRRREGERRGEDWGWGGSTTIKLEDEKKHMNVCTDTCKQKERRGEERGKKPEHNTTTDRWDKKKGEISVFISGAKQSMSSYVTLDLLCIPHFFTPTLLLKPPLLPSTSSFAPLTSAPLSERLRRRRSVCVCVCV